MSERVAVRHQRRAHSPVVIPENRVEFGAGAQLHYFQREANVSGVVVRAADQGVRPGADLIPLIIGQRIVHIPYRVRMGRGRRDLGDRRRGLDDLPIADVREGVPRSPFGCVPDELAN